MQTRFDHAQLADAGIAAAAGAIRKCVHCGFCTATCPTYVLLGDELDSPRGRIYLVKDMLERHARPGAEVVKHLDRCLSCLSCETHCPSGVSYRRVIDQGRAYIEAHHRRPFLERALRAALAQVLPHPARLRVALALGALAAPLSAALARWPATKRWATLLELRRVARRSRPPQRDARAQLATAGPAPAVRGSARSRIGLASGCVGSVLAPEIEAATARLLERAGCEVVRTGEGCCGALSHHMGRESEAQRLARSQVDAWMRADAAAPLDAIVVTTSGCGPVLRDYGHLLAGDARYAGAAARVAHLARDVTEVLAQVGLPPRAAFGRRITVAYQPACSLRHGCGITTEPVDLLARAGFEVRTPPDAHLCCGSAGVYNILQPELARALGTRKAGSLAALAPDVIATGNIGCIMQLRSLATLPVVHVAELLDWATGGPEPAALGSRGAATAGDSPSTGGSV